MGYLLMTIFSMYILSLSQFQNVFSHSPCTTSHEFLVEPTNVHVREGDSATFTCSVRNINKESHVVTWEVFPQFQSTESSEEYENSDLLTSTLLLNSFRGRDRFVSCTVRDRANDDCYDSRSAWAFINCFPTREDINCGHNSIGETEKEQIITFQCRVKSCNPPVDMGWRQNRMFEDNIVATRSATEGHLRVLTQQVKMTHQLYFQKVTCVVTSEVEFPNRQLECHIGPRRMEFPTGFPTYIERTTPPFSTPNCGPTCSLKKMNNSADVSIPSDETENTAFRTESSKSIITHHHVSGLKEDINSLDIKMVPASFQTQISTAGNQNLSKTSQLTGADSTMVIQISEDGKKILHVHHIIAIVVGGIVLVIILIACTVAIVSFTILNLLKKNNSDGTGNTCVTSQSTKQESETLETISISDSMYEVPGVELFPINQKEKLPNEVYDYADNICTSSSNSLESWMSSSSETNINDNSSLSI